MDCFAIGDYITVTNSKLSTFKKVGMIVGWKDQKALVLFFNNTKIAYSVDSITFLQKGCAHVAYNGESYIVTPKYNIISCRTRRIMEWVANHPTRIAILGICDTQLHGE